jgi:hypothetical protein
MDVDSNRTSSSRWLLMLPVTLIVKIECVWQMSISYTRNTDFSRVKTPVADRNKRFNFNSTINNDRKKHLNI